MHQEITAKMSCFVPNCNNSIGMPFPKDEHMKKKWLESLELTAEPSQKSLVCLDHFRPFDIIEQSDLMENNLNPENVGKLVILRKGAVPFVNNCANSNQNEPRLCRVCNGKENLEKNIFDTMENGTTIMSMIMSCSYPIIITKSDGLPKFICTNCLKQLHKSFRFRLKCLKTHKLWNEKLKKQPKRKEEQISNVPKKICLEKPITNEQLAAILKGQDNEEELKPQTLENVTQELENMCENTSEVIQPSIVTNGDEAHSSKVITKMFPNINLPKGIRIKNTPKQSFESNVGIFSCSYEKGPQESNFAIADGYLFTFGLVKGNIRHLKCIISTCKAKGSETMTQSTEQTLTLDVAHNHERPTEQMRKKHMFFYIMRKRMQLDKSLNIRMIYEEICVQEPEIRKLVPLRNVINEICKHQTLGKTPSVKTFEELYEKIEDDAFDKLHFTSDNKQFYQERFYTEDGSYAIIFCNSNSIEQVSKSNLMYVDASFRINSFENFEYHLVTVLVWLDESYYPILFGLVNKKSQEIFVKIFKHLHDVLAPTLRPYEIVTDYESSLYYALGETYLESHIGGSVYYYAQNIYKKICSLDLAKLLETNSNFRNIYHMLLMLPLLPVNTIKDALNTIKVQARDLGLMKIIHQIFDHINDEWIRNVTPELFCVHHLENRINENVIAPFKKLRDYLLFFKGKISQTNIKIVPLIEKLIELESFMRDIYTKGDKKSFARDLSSFQKRNVIRAWLFIESHPKININNFFQKVLGYIKCMENQLWIWGFYGYTGSADDNLISASNFESSDGVSDTTSEEIVESELECEENKNRNTIVMEGLVDNNGSVLFQSEDIRDNSKDLANSILTYVQYDT